MKLTFVVSVLLVGSVAFAKSGHQSIEEMSQASFEVESTELELQELNASRDIAKEETQFVQKQALETKQKLKDTRKQKANVQKKADKEIAVSRDRIWIAEKNIKRDSNETVLLTKEIVKHEKKMDEAILARNKKENVAKEKAMELKRRRDQKEKLISEIKNAEKATRDYERELERTTHQNTMVDSEVRLLKERALKTKAVMKEKKARLDTATRKLEMAKNEREKLQLQTRSLASRKTPTQVR